MPEQLWQTIQRKVEEEFACDHSDRVVRRQNLSDGRRVFVEQCRRCGWTSPHLKHDRVSLQTRQDCPEVDVDLKQDWLDRRLRRQKEIREELNLERRADWFEDHDEYLKTESWRMKRELVLKRDNYLCQGCRSSRAVHVHHLTYENVKDELLFQLVSLCEECHRKAHHNPEDWK